MPTGPGSHIAALDAFVDVLAGIPDDPPTTDDEGLLFYSRLCAAICRMSIAERAIIFRYDEAHRRVRAAGGHGIDLTLFEHAFVTIETLSAARLALAENRVVEVEVSNEVPQEFRDVAGDVRLIVTPISAAGRWIGVVISDRPRDSPLTEGERDTLWTLGKMAALAATARIATYQTERSRELEAKLDMARDIHDGVIQRLFGVSLALSPDGPLDSEARARCADELQAALGDLRDALQRPLGRDSRPTASTLADELGRLNSQHPGLGVVLEHGDPASVPPELEPLAQSVLVEAVRNAHKHATPTSVRVSIDHDDDTFVLAVRNDGVQRGGGTRQLTGMGLRLAALEALQHGGILEFGERSDGEWQVRLVVSGGL